MINNENYNPNKDTRFKTPQIRDDLCDFNHAYIVVAGKITVTNPGNNINIYDIKVSLKNSAPFFNCILKINNQLIEDTQDLDIAMPMYNLLYSSKNFRKTTGPFWNYYPDKPNSAYTFFADTPNNRRERERIFRSIRNSKSFDYKTKFVNPLPGVNDVANNDVTSESEEIKIVIPLENLSNFIFSLDFLMINTEIELILKWSQNCVLTSKSTRNGLPQSDDNPPLPAANAINRPKDLKFNITDCKLYILVVTLQEKYDNELLKDLKTGISFDYIWNRYRTQIINQPSTNNLNFLIDPTFNNVNTLFVLAFPNEEDRSSFSKYYVPNVEIKDYNALIDLQPFYDIPMKNKEETYKNIIELINHDNYTTGNSLDYEYFCKHYKLIAIDLSKQNSDFKNQQINFIGKLEQNATIFFIIEEKMTTGIKFAQNSLTIV